MTKSKTFRNTVFKKENFRLNSSKTLLKFTNDILRMKNSPILDVPSGFGRHSFLFASLGCKVICVDINQNALDYISESQGKIAFEESLTTLNIDLEKDSWPFKKESIGAIVNVHYYKYDLLDKFISSLMLGGFLYLETPGGYGRNYRDLPIKDFIRNKLGPYFNLSFYKENKAGPVELNRVTVKVFAQKVHLFPKE